MDVGPFLRTSRAVRTRVEVEIENTMIMERYKTGIENGRPVDKDTFERLLVMKM